MTCLRDETPVTVSRCWPWRKPPSPRKLWLYRHSGTIGYVIWISLGLATVGLLAWTTLRNS